MPFLKNYLSKEIEPKEEFLLKGEYVEGGKVKANISFDYDSTYGSSGFGNFTQFFSSISYTLNNVPTTKSFNANLNPRSTGLSPTYFCISNKYGYNKIEGVDTTTGNTVTWQISESENDVLIDGNLVVTSKLTILPGPMQKSIISSGYVWFINNGLANSNTLNSELDGIVVQLGSYIIYFKNTSTSSS